MAFTFGNRIKITLFGESHGKCTGVVIDGLPAGYEPDFEKINAFLDRRRPSQKAGTARKETDVPEILSGLFEGRTCGTPLCAVFYNTDVNNGDYEKLKNIPRPGHADYPAYVRYNGFNDYRGGGAFSGRMTCPLCFAGAVLIQLLEEKDIVISSSVVSVGGKKVSSVEEADGIITEAKSRGDSVGGKIKCTISGLPAGIGEPFFDSVESRISSLCFSVPAVKGIEFGTTADYGSENNDAYFFENGKVITKTNHCGGILGGLTTGGPVEFTCTVKPTPSITAEQNTVNLESEEEIIVSVTGRHDSCIVPRILPCIESAAAIALADWILL